MKVLLVATSSYAGMGAYVCGLVNCFQNNQISVFLIDGKNAFYQKNISNENIDKLVIVRHDNTAWNKLRLLIRPPHKIILTFKKLCREEKFDVIHFLSGEALYGELIRWAQMRSDVFLTVHDATPHDAQKSIHKLIRQKIIYRKLFRVLRDTNNLITNSHSQYQKLEKTYPEKNIFYHSFPSLVMESVANGKSSVPELKGIDRYILFFGRIEKYKGVDLLYRAFIESEELNTRHHLVIAGSGDIYFPRELKGEMGHVIFINRYIKDEEIATLYKNAACVVYPYISATQSGVLSLSCYFRVPTIVSDISYFKEQLVTHHIANTFECNNISSLRTAIINVLNDNCPDLKEIQKKYYDLEYRQESLEYQIYTIYADLKKGLRGK